MHLNYNFLICYMPHDIEVFSAGCPLCREVVDLIAVGKCAGCSLTEYNLTNSSPELKQKIRGYGIKVVPTVIIDGTIKIEGRPDFPFICDENLYQFLKEKYPLK